MSRGFLTTDGGAVWVLGLLQPGHGQGGLDPHVGELVGHADQHGLVEAVKQVVVDLGVLRHAAQQLVDQLAHTETHRVAVGLVGLRGKPGQRAGYGCVKG